MPLFWEQIYHKALLNEADPACNPHQAGAIRRRKKRKGETGLEYPILLYRVLWRTKRKKKGGNETIFCRYLLINPVRYLTTSQSRAEYGLIHIWKVGWWLCIILEPIQILNAFSLERLAEEEQEAERTERVALLAAIEEHKRLEAENQERIKNRNVSHQRDLDMQIDYQRRVKAKEMEEEEREFRMGQVS